MAQNTSIEWTDRSSNPIRVMVNGQRKGWFCTKVSAGCAHCYSERLNKRFGNKLSFSKQNEGKVTFILDEKELLSWYRINEPRRIFVCDMTDLFHPLIPDAFVSAVWWAMEENPQHTFQVLTKRPERMASLLGSWAGKGIIEMPLPNVWLGVSAEDQRNADLRRGPFEAVPAAVKFVSYEPALGKVDWRGWEFIDWLICGGESGPGARPMHPDRARSARDWAQDNNVAFFFKQHGAWISRRQIADFTKDGWKVRGEWLDAIRGKEWGCLDIAGKYWKETTTWNGNEENFVDEYEATVYRVGKKAAGRLLDGREWSEFPDVP